MDILIYAKPEKIEHKMKKNIAEGCYCYWETSRIPAPNKLLEVEKVYFSDRKKIYAEGKFLPDLTDSMESAICFDPLIKVNKKQPKKPPTRGWCYINKEE